MSKTSQQDDFRTPMLLAFALVVGCRAAGPEFEPIPDDASTDGESGSAMGDLPAPSASAQTGDSPVTTTYNGRVYTLVREGGPPRYQPPPGFEDCEHAPVEANCSDGWCRIPAGCFVMGSPEDEPRRAARGEEQVAVTFSRSFLMQQTEMTQGQWRTITGQEPAKRPNCQADDCPVTMVDWFDAATAANMLSEGNGLPPCYALHGCRGEPGVDLECEDAELSRATSIYDCAGYRLPTRAEFEYASRAGTTTEYYSGERTLWHPWWSGILPDANLERIGWYGYNSGGYAHPVAQLQPNGFGLYDTIGNVYEWLSGTDDTGRANEGGVDPSRGKLVSKYVTAASCAYNLFSAACRVAGRHTSLEARSRFETGGFRLVRTMHPESE